MIEAAIKAQALGLGFDLVGIARTGVARTAIHFDEWLSRGHAGAMSYLAKRSEVRRDTRLPFDGARSAIVVALDYGGREPSGSVARYARGDDYHDVLLRMLGTLHEWIDHRMGSQIIARAYVDTGPLLERDLAQRAGLGWFGKNTMLINPTQGSFFFLGALLVDLELAPDNPFDDDRCGSCTRCIDACPTDAIMAPRELDATRCISYLTIELRGAIPEELRAPVGELVYGCDICQDVCPYNVKFARVVAKPEFAARRMFASRDGREIAREILALDVDAYRERFSRSPMKRAKLRGLKRNAAVVLGNVGDERDLSLLATACDDPDILVSDHASWATAAINSRLRDLGGRLP